jgi:hypothetical protein
MVQNPPSPAINVPHLFDLFQVENITMVRGGVERYMRTYPEGGFWKGKNYLFDRRFEQVPESKPLSELEKDVESSCCVCSKPWYHLPYHNTTILPYTTTFPLLETVLRLPPLHG